MTKRAKFSKGLDVREPKVLILAISMDNKKQTLEDFEAFVELVNRHSKRIAGVRVVLSCYLQRHYVGIEEATKLYDKWKKENGSFLKKFTVSTSKIEPESWEKIIKDSRYDEAFKKANEEYATSKDFRDIVDNLARKFSWKKTFEDAKNYLLDECAGLLVLSYDGVIAYPHHKLNDAADYFLNKYNPSHSYAGYEIHAVKQKENIINTKLNNEEALISTCFGLTKLMEINGIFGEKKQTQFFQQFMKMKTQFATNEIIMEESLNVESQTTQGSQASTLTQ